MEATVSLQKKKKKKQIFISRNYSFEKKQKNMLMGILIIYMV